MSPPVRPPGGVSSNTNIISRLPADRVSVLEDRSLRLERVTIADEGEYSCEADNVVGAITAMGTLTVFGK